MWINMEKSRDYQMGNCVKLPFSVLKQIVPHRVSEIISGERTHLLLFLSTPSRHITERQRGEIMLCIQLHNGDRGQG